MSDAVSLALWSAVSAAGLFSVVLLSLGTATGLRVRSGRPLPLLDRAGTVRVHRHLTALGTIGLAVHVTLAILDPYTQLTALAAVLPFTAPDSPLAYGIGTLALWAIAAVVGTSIVRRILPQRLWGTVHLAAYGAWALGILHSVLAPSTSGLPGLVVTACCTLLVLVAAVDALWLRPAPLLLSAERRRRPRALTAASALAPAPALRRTR